MVEKNDGFTLVEVTVSMVVSVILLLALHTGTKTAIDTRKRVEREFAINQAACRLVARLMRVPFGHLVGRLAPSSAQLDEVFDDDDDAGTLSLAQLLVAPDHDGYRFQAISRLGSGRWEVRITNDLNGDGDNTDAREGRADLFRIEVFFAGRPIVQTLREAPAAQTQTDTSVTYATHG